MCVSVRVLNWGFTLTSNPFFPCFLLQSGAAGEYTALYINGSRCKLRGLDIEVISKVSRGSVGARFD